MILNPSAKSSNKKNQFLIYNIGGASVSKGDLFSDNLQLLKTMDKHICGVQPLKPSKVGFPDTQNAL